MLHYEELIIFSLQREAAHIALRAYQMDFDTHTTVNLRRQVEGHESCDFKAIFHYPKSTNDN